MVQIELRERSGWLIPTWALSRREAAKTLGYSVSVGHEKRPSRAAGKAQMMLVSTVLLAAATACSMNASASQVDRTQAALVAEADMFSGRENPTWPLDKAAMDAVSDCVRADARTDARLDPPSNDLGFRGIVVTGVTIDGDANASLRAVPGSTTVTANGEEYTIRTCQGLFAALRESASANLKPDEVALIPK